MFPSTCRPTQASSVWRSTHTGYPSMELKWPRSTRGRNATKFPLTSSPSMTTPTTTWWWVRRGRWTGVENKLFNQTWVGEGREVRLAKRRCKHAGGMWCLRISPLRRIALKSLNCSMWKEGVGQLLEACNQCGVWCVQGVEKYLKPLYGIRGELAAVCVVGTADSEHQQSSDLLTGKSAVIILVSLTHYVSLLPSFCPIITEHENQSMLIT